MSKLLTVPPLHDYQEEAAQFILDNPYCGLLLEMGLGKTRSTLEALSRIPPLQRGTVLIAAPKFVAMNTWPEEINKWGFDFTYSIAIGTVKKRLEAINAPVDIVLINRENLVWLYEQYNLPHKWPFKTVVLDELSSYKSHRAVRFKALKAVRPYMDRVIGLTGTPAPNGLIDLWAQMYLLDRGARLYTTITKYREEFFHKEKLISKHVSTYGLGGASGGEEEIHRRIEDICLSMRAADKLKLPPRTDNAVKVYMTAAEKASYDELEDEFILDVKAKSGDVLGTVTAANAGVLTNKLLQLANGTVYGEDLDGDRAPITIHRQKQIALTDLIDEMQGNPLLVFYWFKHDIPSIQAAAKSAGKSLTLFDGKPATIKAWLAGDIEVLGLHPLSAGHGLNLQTGPGHTACWYSLTSNLEAYLQSNARIDRQGQRNPVVVHHLITQGTRDENAYEALIAKKSVQDAVMEALRHIGKLGTVDAEWDAVLQ